MSRYARRKDSNQLEITAMAHACGFITLDTSAFGDSFPDMMTAFEVKPGQWINDLWEVKTLKGKLREGQTKFFETWPGPKAVVRTPADVLARRAYWLQLGQRMAK